jgi:F0F1-type ATP synthase beta subunit
MQERITSTNKDLLCTSGLRADDLTDPAPAATFALMQQQYCLVRLLSWYLSAV